MGIDIGRARPEDVGDVLRLLSEHHLPPDGLSAHSGTLLVARQGGRIAGSAALEVHTPCPSTATVMRELLRN